MSTFLQALITVLLLLILVALAVIAVQMSRRRRERSAAQGRSGADPHAPGRKPLVDPFADVGEVAGDPRTIKAGDMLEYLGRRYFVRGSLRLVEGGYRWSEHFLDDTEGTKRWLSVEEDPDLEVVMWVERPDDELLPSERTLTVDGVEYRRNEHGTATYTSEGSTGVGERGQVEYVDYEAVGKTSGPRYLAFERYGGAGWEAGVGEQVPNGSLTVYPGS